MAGITVNADTGPVQRALRRVADTLDGDRARYLFDAIGQTLVTSTVERFERETGPDGQPWQPSARALAQGGKTLSDSGRLRGSITHVAGREGVDVGTNVIYGAIHQFGSGDLERPTGIPARPYLGLDDGDRRAVERLVERFIGTAA